MAELKELLAMSNKALVDVRTPAECAEGMLPGAVNIPLDQVSFRTDEIKELGSPVLLYCRSGGRSGMAESILKQAGLTEVYNIGGYEALRSNF
jgi:phage shock protein E